MTTSTSLIDMILALLRDPDQRAEFQQNPSAYLASCGGDLSPEDVRDAIVLADDSDDDDDRGSHHTGGSHHPAHVPPPHATHPHPGESDHDAAVRYLQTYVTNNYTTENNTDIDNSIHQHVDTDGGDFTQDIDSHQVVASGAGSVAAGHNIDGTTTTGSGNQVGDGNVHGSGNVVGDGNQAATGDHDTTSFGSGAATSSSIGGNVHTGNGSSFSGTGPASTDNTDNSISHSLNDSSDHSTDHSFNDESDNSDHSDNSLHHSQNDESDASSHTDSSQHDVGNVHI